MHEVSLRFRKRKDAIVTFRSAPVHVTSCFLHLAFFLIQSYLSGLIVDIKVWKSMFLKMVKENTILFLQRIKHTCTVDTCVSKFLSRPTKIMQMVAWPYKQNITRNVGQCPT